MSMFYWIIEVRKEKEPPEMFYYPAGRWASDEALADAQANCKPGEKAVLKGKELT